MKFLVNAQLPRRLAVKLRREGFEAIHTLDLPLGNRASDAMINGLSFNERYVVVTKDTDFVDSFFVHGQPWKLLLISTGNITNDDLEALIQANMKTLVEGFESFDFIEMNRTNLLFHL